MDVFGIKAYGPLTLLMMTLIGLSPPFGNGEFVASWMKNLINVPFTGSGIPLVVLEKLSLLALSASLFPLGLLWSLVKPLMLSLL